MIEDWKEIKSYKGLYWISSRGEVKSKKRQGSSGRMLKQSLTTTGYQRVILCKNQKKKQFKIHQLVAEAYISNPHNRPLVLHGDGNKLNNNSTNLYWGSYTDNANDKIRHKLKGRGRWCKQCCSWEADIYKQRPRAPCVAHTGMPYREYQRHNFK